MFRLVPRAHVTAWASAFGVALLTVSTPSQACHGPCSTPEFWEIAPTAQPLSVVTNFGLLQQEGDSWRVVCEEALGGLLLKAEFDEASGYALTNDGLFSAGGDACDWEAADGGNDDAWMLDFTLPRTNSGAADTRYALVILSPSNEVQVRRATLDGDFELLQSFGENSGFGEIIGAGDPASLFVTGYTFMPRVWHVAYSLDAGESWSDFSVEADDSTRNFVPVAIDPDTPEKLLLSVRTLPAEPDEVYLFDASSNELTQLLVFDEGDAFGGLAITSNGLYVAARGDEQSTIYRADSPDESFEPVSTTPVRLGCLNASGDTLIACSNDLTRDSRFVIARSEDEGRSWQPSLTLAELGTLQSCSTTCDPTVEWLHALYGGLAPQKEDTTGCACHVLRSPRSGYPALAILLFAMIGRRKLSRNARKFQFLVKRGGRA